MYHDFAINMRYLARVVIQLVVISISFFVIYVVNKIMCRLITLLTFNIRRSLEIYLKKVVEESNLPLLDDDDLFACI